MPPKKGGDKKTSAQKQKIVEDKTFGLKNKKGAKAQKIIQHITKQVNNKPPPNRAGAVVDQNAERQKKIEADRKAAEELRTLFKPVLQTIPKGVDPKSVVCMYFKQGTCQKGDRCKFSHDLAVERKAEKRNLYEDTRENDTMADWDEAKLDDVINQKHGEDNKKKKTTTEIVCKFFLESVEKKTYGWFWNCPNGEKCMYKHALPPGFVLKSEMKAMNDKKNSNEVSLEMLIEKERASLGKTVTKVTLESFLKWKKRKIIEKKEEKIIAETKKQNNFKLGLHNGLSGRDLFTFNPALVGDDDDGVDDGIDYRRRDGDDDLNTLECRDVDMDKLQGRENDGTGTEATDDRFSYMDSVLKQEKDNELASGGGDVEVEDVESRPTSSKAANDDDLTEAEHEASLKKAIGSDKSNKTNKKSAKNPTAAAKIEIDESLFNVDELDNIEDELDDLDIDD